MINWNEEKYCKLFDIFVYTFDQRFHSFQEEGGHAQEKSIVKKERQLKIREEELKRNLQELGQDVAAITANAPSEAAEQAAPGIWLEIILKRYLFHQFCLKHCIDISTFFALCLSNWIWLNRIERNVFV